MITYIYIEYQQKSYLKSIKNAEQRTTQSNSIEIIKPITNENTPKKQSKKPLIYIKYEYEAKFGPSEELYDMEVYDEATIQEIKNKLKDKIVFGDLEVNQYPIYKGGHQEDKDKSKNREPMKYYKYTEPVLLEDDHKTLKYYGIYANELLHLEVQLNCC